MDNVWTDRDTDHVLVNGQSTEEFLTPLKRSSRLKYNCISVSRKIVAIGSNTGGIYVFSRTDQRLLQIAFAEKETNSVSLVKISPHEKYVAFVSASNVYVLDLKLDSRCKAETLRSTSDLSDRMVTCLLWDQSSSKIFMGDDLGKVSMMQVYSNKAKNLFSLPLEVIMKLDSAIVQIDKAEEKILVSTLTRCYLCDTTKQQYSQIGKKLRDGQFGACFLTQETSSPMIYSARPGSRIWEVDFDGNVLNTHQFKQLLAVPPSHVISLDQKYSSDIDSSEYKAQSVTFSRLITLRNNFLLTWTQSAVYILDPINVKVILWTNQFSGIQDMCCVDNDIFIFFTNMEIKCLNFYAVTSVIPIYLKVKDMESAALMCLKFKDVFLHKHVRKKFGIPDLQKIHENLVQENLEDLAEQIHDVIVDIETKVASESENEASGSGRSRSNSEVSRASTGSAGLTSALSIASTGSSGSGGAVNEISTGTREITGVVNKTSDISNGPVAATSDTNTSNGGALSEIYLASSGSCRVVSEKDGSSSQNVLVGVVTTENIVTGKERYGNDSNISNNMPDSEKSKKEVKENKSERIVQNKDCLNKGLNDAVDSVNDDRGVSAAVIESSTENGEEILHNKFEEENVDKIIRTKDHAFESEHSEKFLNETNSHMSDSQSAHEVSRTEKENNIEKLEHSLSSRPMIDNGIEGRSFGNETGESHNVTNDNTQDTNMYNDLTVTKLVNVGVDINMEIEDDVGLLPPIAMGPRRLSLTSLSSIDSGEVNFDQPFNNDFDESSDKIGIPMKRKSGKKKRRRSSAIEHTDNNFETPAGRMTRSLSAGTMQQLSSSKERSPSPHGTSHSVKEEDSISIYSNDSLIEDIGNDSTNRHSTESYNEVILDSGDFGISGDFRKSGEYLQSGELSPRETTLSRSWEKNKQSSSPSASKAAFMQLKNKMQTKVTSGTKNLIKNIKEKNLLSKAKEFAENLSQGSEVYLHSGDTMFSDSPDILMSHPDFIQNPRNAEKQVTGSGFDATDSVEKISFECGELEKITSETREKLEDIQILMNPDTVYQVLSDWVIVLNNTFREFHVKKYGVLDLAKDGEGFKAVSEKPDTNSLQGETAEENNTDRENKEGKEDGISENFDEKNKGVDEKSDVRIPESVFDIIGDNHFCYLSDPFCLSQDVFQDVCEFAQACFDIGCHGDILKIFKSRNNDKKGKIMNTMPNPDKVVEQMVVKQSNVSDLESRKVGQRAHNNELNVDSEFIQCSGNSSESVNEETNTESVALEVSDDQKEDKKLNSCDKDCDNKTVSEPSNLSEQNVLEEIDIENNNLCKGNPVAHVLQNEKDDGDKAILDSENNNLNLENVPRSEDQAISMDNFDDKVKNFVEDTSSYIEDESETRDKAMGFFVRCYFPYLNILKVREETLKNERSYHLWRALVVCMEGKARFDSERYGIADTSVVNHLMENQAATDKGAMLLGHISNLCDSNTESIVDLCVRCQPFIHPVDVMYLCRFHQVAMETVFKQYMILMTLDETSSIKEHTLTAVSKNLETSVAWVDLLLTEDRNPSALMDEHGCPRCMAHKVRRKNEELISQLTKYIEDEDIKTKVLELFRKHGYWSGLLKFLKMSGCRSEHLNLVLQLRDIDLLNGISEFGYEAQSVSEWQDVLLTYQKVLSEHGNQITQEVKSDWPSLITWNNLAILLARHIGSEETVSLLDKIGIPDGELSVEFYQTCLLSGMVQRQQRLVLHSMLEKVDSYLWSQRPTALTPQLLYLATVEKKGPTSETSSTQTDRLSTMVGKLKEGTPEQYVEDPECHWGIETKINVLCPCCGIALKETVTHEQPGVLIFKCGHGYHKFCLPYKECILCDDTGKDNSAKKLTFI